MVVNVPRIVETVANDPRDMVRVQLSPNDTRSYTRMEAEKLIEGGSVPGAYILGEQPDDATEEAPAKARRSAPNKARTTTAPASKPAEQPAPAETKAPDAAADPPAETKS
jgi:hypothetical protein